MTRFFTHPPPKPAEGWPQWPEQQMWLNASEAALIMRLREMRRTAAKELWFDHKHSPRWVRFTICGCGSIDNIQLGPHGGPCTIDDWHQYEASLKETDPDKQCERCGGRGAVPEDSIDYAPGEFLPESPPVSFVITVECPACLGTGAR